MRGLYALIVVCLTAAPVAAQGSVGIAWDAATIADGYTVQIGAAPGATVKTVDVGAETATRLDFAAPGTFYVRVVAYNASGVSGPSDEVTVAIDGPPPPPPPPTDPCVAEPLAVVVTVWPAKKQAAQWTASQDIASVTWLKRKSDVYGAAFVDTRGCSVTVLK